MSNVQQPPQQNQQRAMPGYVLLASHEASYVMGAITAVTGNRPFS